MAVHTVNDDILLSPAALAYFSRADRRVLIGLRATLEMLGIPVPEYAERRPPGRPPSRAVTSAYRADNPGEPERKTVGSDPLHPRRIAAAVAKAQTKADARATRSLYDTTFNG